MRKGQKATAEQIEKNRISHLGQKCSDGTRKKLSEANKGRIFTEEHKQNISLSKIGKPNIGMIGYRHSEESKKLMSSKKIGKAFSEGHKEKLRTSHLNPSVETRKKMRDSHLGKEYCEETRIKMSLAKRLENHPAWLGGKSFEPYGLEFNGELKTEIRSRDSYICQECNISQEELGYQLSVHHIDYNKLNSIPTNLISLCKSCHAKTNANRRDWTEYYMKGLELRHEFN